MGNDSSKDANSETISSVSSKVTNSKQSNFTEEEIQLGAKLENLCKNIKPMASSICKIFKVTHITFGLRVFNASYGIE